MMPRNLKIFLLSLVLSLPLWWGTNTFSESLTDFLFWRGMATNPRILAAQVAEQELAAQLAEARPIRRRNTPDLSLQANSALSIFTNENGKEKILFEKNSDTPLPIASLTKLMSALVAMEEYPTNQKIAMSPTILAEEGDTGFLRVEDVFTVKDLLYLLLIESSNDAAAALADPIGREVFVERMNEQARSLGLQNTVFFNPTGLDSDEPANYSTTRELSALTSHILENYPQIFDILGLREFDLFTLQEEFHHTMVNTNELLHDASWQVPILGGKTGWTPLAQGCLLLVVESPKKNGLLISVILGSEDRFGEMRKMVDWAYQSYRW